MTSCWKSQRHEAFAKLRAFLAAWSWGRDEAQSTRRRVREGSQ